jgi:hypothetical protein
MTGEAWVWRSRPPSIPVDAALDAGLADWEREFLERQALRDRVDLLERQRQAVLDYVANLECTNCEHVHDEGDCGAAIPDGRACRCTWGPPAITEDIRDLLKEHPQRIIGYRWTDPTTGVARMLRPEDVAVVMAGES